MAAQGCRSTMLSRDDVPNVEVGLLLDRPCPLTGLVTAHALPAGTAATSVHRGPLRDVGAPHDAVVRWRVIPGALWPAPLGGLPNDGPAR